MKSGERWAERSLGGLLISIRGWKLAGEMVQMRWRPAQMSKRFAGGWSLQACLDVMHVTFFSFSLIIREGKKEMADMGAMSVI